MLDQMVVMWSIKIGSLFKLNKLNFHLKFLSFGMLWLYGQLESSDPAYCWCIENNGLLILTKPVEIKRWRVVHYASECQDLLGFSTQYEYPHIILKVIQISGSCSQYTQSSLLLQTIEHTCIHTIHTDILYIPWKCWHLNFCLKLAQLINCQNVTVGVVESYFFKPWPLVLNLDLYFLKAWT